MSKNVVVCCDGTGNEFGGDCNSNVVKLYSTLVIDGSQVAYYHPGVGTMGSPLARSWMGKQWSRMKGLAFGAGFTANVGDAYRYLMDTYEEGDTLYIFGFSRGSYTARALTGMLYMYGLLQKRNYGLIPYVQRMFARETKKAGGIQEKLKVAEKFKATFSRECKPYFMGLWDTVSSVGWIHDPMVLPYTRTDPDLQIGRHAVSIHERRCYYRQNLWGASAGQDIKQVWFTGAHSDVGGSYPEQESGLSQVTLQWMLQEAYKADLKIDLDKAAIVLGKKPDVIRHDELKHWFWNAMGWWMLELLPHSYMEQSGNSWRKRWRIPLGAPRRIPEKSWIYALADVPPEVTSFKREPEVKFPPAEAEAIAAAAGSEQP